MPHTPGINLKWIADLQWDVGFNPACDSIAKLQFLNLSSVGYYRVQIAHRRHTEARNKEPPRGRRGLRRI